MPLLAHRFPSSLSTAPTLARTVFYHPHQLHLRQPLITRTFSSSPANMTIKAWFDVEYTDAALDKARADAKRSGASVPPRKFSIQLLDEHALQVCSRRQILGLCSTSY
jgi:hypothetical protein